MYALASLGCYGLGALGYGMMVFRVCPEEADLLQKVEADLTSKITSVLSRASSSP
jgi:hypothetical protein